MFWPGGALSERAAGSEAFQRADLRGLGHIQASEIALTLKRRTTSDFDEAYCYSHLLAEIVLQRTRLSWST